jgi:hypothetical protein
MDRYAHLQPDSEARPRISLRKGRYTAMSEQQQQQQQQQSINTPTPEPEVAKPFPYAYSIIEGNRLLDFRTPTTPESKHRVHNHLLNANPYAHLSEHQRDAVNKAVQARLNARKSTGPRTEEGKQIAAQNARKHGYASAKVVLHEEDHEAYNLHLDSYFDSLQPVTQIECDYVRRIADAQWRLDRLCSIETGLLDLEYDYVVPFAHVVYDPEAIEYHHYLAIAFLEKVNTDNALDLCRRYQSAASRDADRALKMFLILKAERTKGESIAHEAPPKFPKRQRVPNEPTPIREKSPAPAPEASKSSPATAKTAIPINRRRKDRRKNR